MKFPFVYVLLTGVLVAGLCPVARAFPPAPSGLIYGMVKDQYGTPLTTSADGVVLQTASGVQVTGTIQPGLAIGVNYAIYVPMDAGTMGTPFKANALVAATQYKLYVTVGTQTNLPLEMTGGYVTLGGPASQACQNLTLGTDSNGDGIPDAWEHAFLFETGNYIALSAINPNKDYTGSGRTLKQEYLLGNYPFNPPTNSTSDFAVQIVSQTNSSATIAFTTMTGRSYTAYGSADLQNWAPLNFTVPSAGSNVVSFYYAPTIQPVQIQTVAPTNGLSVQFFKVELQ